MTKAAPWSVLPKGLSEGWCPLGLTCTLCVQQNDTSFFRVESTGREANA